MRPIILMEGETTITTLWTAVSSGVGSFMSIVGSVGNALISNTLFQVVFGMYVAFRAISAFRRLVRVR